MVSIAQISMNPWLLQKYISLVRSSTGACYRGADLNQAWKDWTWTGIPAFVGRQLSPGCNPGESLGFCTSVSMH